MLSWKQLHNDMEACEQMPGMTMIGHGRSVYKYLDYLNEMLSLGIAVKDKFREKLDWRLPSWFEDYQEELSDARYCSNITYWYTCYHDCGKPYVKVIDENGKSHFPNHAESSYQTWLKVNQEDSINLPKKDIEIIGQLILHDMDLHTFNSNQIDQLINQYDKRMLVTLLLTALAEIHSNAAMFGPEGVESTSFKIKFKQIERRGKQICKKLFGEKEGWIKMER